MHGISRCAAIFAVLVGCGGGVVRAPVAGNAAAFVPAPPSLEAVASGEAVATLGPSAAPQVEVASLPAPPWADAPISMSEAPSTLVAAWERAENRDWCAPIVPRHFGAAEGARARASNLEGGWAVEFDLRGMRGVARDGTVCDRCGRGVFGVAGTSMTPDEIVSPDSEAILPVPSFADGSHAEFELDETEQVAAATITLSGQGCVYQVWTFLGREHLDQLVAELRRVAVPPPQGRSDGALARATPAPLP
jgi:hypothetical protein